MQDMGTGPSRGQRRAAQAAPRSVAGRDPNPPSLLMDAPATNAPGAASALDPSMAPERTGEAAGRPLGCRAGGPARGRRTNFMGSHRCSPDAPEDKGREPKRVRLGSSSSTPLSDEEASEVDEESESDSESDPESLVQASESISWRVGGPGKRVVCFFGRAREELFDVEGFVSRRPRPLHPLRGARSLHRAHRAYPPGTSARVSSLIDDHPPELHP